MDIVDTDGQGVCLRDDELDQLQFVGGPVALPSPVPVFAGARHRRQDRVDLYGGPLAVQNHLGSKPTGVRRERGLEPAEVSLFDQLEVDRSGIGRRGDSLQPLQRLLAAVLDLLSSGERVVVKLARPKLPRITTR
jgi:hypothetical protein